MKVTKERKLAELKRELDVRKRMYPHWIYIQKIDKATAELRITVLEDIIADYENDKLACAGKQETLF